MLIYCATSDCGGMEMKMNFIPIALLMVYIFWGGTYLGMRVAIETMPPFIMAGFRFVTAGLILYIWARLSGVERPKKEHWREMGIVGALLLLGGNGVVAWAEQLVPTGIASLIIATVPLWMILLNWAGKDGKIPNFGEIVGILLGLSGIGLLVMQSTGTTDDKSISPLGITALIFAAISWSIGSLYSRKAKQPNSPIMATALQMIVGGLLLLGASIFLGEWTKLDLSQISLRSSIALGYLIIFGSIIGYNAYIWLLKNAEPSLASTYAYVNPVVALFLGWLLAGEQITIYSLFAAIIIITSVIIITVYRDRPNLNMDKQRKSINQGKQEKNMIKTS